MAVHTDTKGLLTYQPKSYPNIPGGEANYLSGELGKLSNAINKLVDVMRIIETRLNTNGLT